MIRDRERLQSHECSSLRAIGKPLLESAVSVQDSNVRSDF